jgi:hypothetical protein
MCHGGRNGQPTDCRKQAYRPAQRAADRGGAGCGRKVETLDVPYLPLVILNAARLPLSDSFQERQRILKMCNGRYYTCEPRNTIMAFHRRLIDSGVIDAH